MTKIADWENEEMKKKYLPALLFAVLAAGFLWVLMTWHIVDGTFYARNTTHLDLRGQSITPEHYEKLRKKLPQADIRWDIPFQGAVLSDDTAELTVMTLTEEESRLLADHLPKLRAVHAQQCEDYENLVLLKTLRPEVQVDYRVELNGKNYSGTAVSLTLEGIGAGEAEKLSYFPLLKTVTVTGGEAEPLQQLRAACEERGLAFRIRINGENVPENIRSANFREITDQQLGLLSLLPKLNRLHLPEPAASAENLLRLRETLPETTVTWEKTVLGLTFPCDAKDIDLTDTISLAPGQRPGDKTGYQYGMEFPVQGTQEEIRTAIKMSKYHPVADRTEETKTLIAQVEEAMAYFPEAERVVMVGGLLHNVYMDNFREAHREDYKVVWSVPCGNVLTRTDAEFFMPVKYHVYYLNDDEAYNLRYLEDVVAVDIGHMNVSDISFVKYMHKLEYLILAHTSIRYIEPIRSCKNLKFLEVDWTGIQDLSPLVDCTALEDLNIGNTGVKVDPLKEMTWLKNLWMIFKGSAYVMTQALPDTRVVASGTATVDSGWRDLPNYYAMRDCLKMYYMSW